MDFSTIWQYVGICNQLLAAFVLWMATAYLIGEGKPHWMVSLPAAFLTFVCVSYFFIAPYKAGGLHLAPLIGYIAGAAAAIALLIYFIIKGRKQGSVSRV